MAIKDRTKSSSDQSAENLAYGPTLADATRTSSNRDSGQRLTPLSPPTMTSDRSSFSPAVISQPQSTLGDLVGARTPTAYGATGRFGFAKGGKVGGKLTPAEAVHKHERNMHKGKKPTKMAKGGSASKRADGCATKGKTKGRFV